MSVARSRIEVASIPRKSLLSIGQVLAKLTPEFPELSPSKLRFLEDRDLIAPGRTPAGYRTYSSDDVERLRFVLTVQRDQYLPLKVIKAYLDDRDAGNRPAATHCTPWAAASSKSAKAACCAASSSVGDPLLRTRVTSSTRPSCATLNRMSTVPSSAWRLASSG